MLFYSSAIESCYQLRTDLWVWNNMADSPDWDAEIVRNSFYGFQSSTWQYYTGWKNHHKRAKKQQGRPWSFWTDTADKIEEGLQQLSDDTFYKLLPSPIVVETARKVKQVVLNLYCSGHIDSMSFKWLNDVQDKPRIPELYTLTNIHKSTSRPPNSRRQQSPNRVYF